MDNNELKQLTYGANQALRLYHTLLIINLNNRANEVLREKLSVVMTERKQVRLSRKYDKILYQILESKRELNKLEEK